MRCKHNATMKGWAIDTHDNQIEWKICDKCGTNYDYSDVERK